ncbi:SpvB/TcaC N-terminal domain-containing protein [Pandoraea sp.]|uniref:SpvB/TcaC N-terminal domain-containing protein n=1 Tax=Pandoraea sp. TaxID=1883445 RepID=UPI0012294925|nr:SpvB/TcaC N-terminal domain-containing protein [Pandoraea sp.]TAL53381.1 MAG: toxin [Pandoraea sp.]TAM20471.1 MAG: toxin [Pandoraea sp.]
MTFQHPQVSVPELSLPKGGGTIAGLARAIDSVGISGAASMSVPLPISPGRGFAPSLGLNYQSSAGNGLFGMGWHVGIPVIACRTSKGVPHYTDDDEIQGPGGEPVVRELDTNGQPVQYVASSLLGRPLGGRQFTVARFVPRVAGDFSRIERWTPRDGADRAEGARQAAAFWVVHGSDGTLHLYGVSAGARIADPADPDVRVARWLLEESVSPTGEHIVYCYAPENDAGLGQADLQRDHQANRYLQRVCYGNVTAAELPYLLTNALPDTWHFELVFDYGERPSALDAEPPYAATAVWLPRQDPHADFSAGFEVRTHRLCRQVLMFHSFPNEGLGASPALVQRLVFEYEQSPYVTLLRAVRSVGHGPQGASATLPPTEFVFSGFDLAALSAAGYRPFSEALTGLDDGQRYQLVDLYGEGIAGVLYRDPQGWRYRAPVRKTGGDAGADDVTYDVWQPLPHQPVGQPADSRAMLTDLSGDGRLDWVLTQSGMAGFFTQRPDKTWSDFTPFQAFPSEFLHPHAMLANLVGAGLTDLALIGPNSVRLYASRRELGFAPPADVPHTGTALPLAGAAHDEVVAFADVLGSGNAHLVRIRHDGLTCWPSLGHGRFGRPIAFAALPFTSDEFVPSQVFLADLDGSGAADLIVAKSDGILIFRNRSGNGFAAPATLPLPEGVRYDPLCQIAFADIDGRGCASLVLSVPHQGPHGKARHWRYDFADSKPYLLVRINNNLGARTRLTYRSSAQEWLDEKQADPLAVSRLPFPMHVVSRITQQDEITGNTLTQCVRYRHGYYDGRERELRGFGLVMTTDTEAFGAPLERDASRSEIGGNVEPAAEFVPPVLSKTWYDTGAPDAARNCGDYATGDAEAIALGGPLFLRWDPDTGEDEIVHELDEATREDLLRALKGTPLRTELYGLDGSSRQHAPYQVSQTRHAVRLVQARGAQRYAVALPLALENVTLDYQRFMDDPVCVHQVTLGWDRWGLPTHQVSVTYPRRSGAACPYPADTPEAAWWHDAHDPQQRRWLLAETRQSWRHVCGPHAFRLGLADQASSHALAYPATGDAVRVSYEALRAPGGWLDPTRARVTLGRQITHYVERDGQPLPAGLVACSESAVLDADALALYCGWLDGEALDQALTQAGFVPMSADSSQRSEKARTPDYWAVRGGICTYAGPAGFYRLLSVRPNRSTGPSTVHYDRYWLNVLAVEDPAGLRSHARYDYRRMSPVRVEDANGNVHEAAYDSLGRLTVASYHGSEDGAPAGFAPLREHTAPALSLDAALAAPAEALQGAACLYCYEAFSWMTHRVPVHSAALAADRYPGDPAQQIAVSVTYSDGFGRALQTKQLHEPGVSYRHDGQGRLLLDATGEPVQSEVATRWAVSGRVEYNNKGWPVRTYQPYFIDTHGVVDDAACRRFGHCDTCYYDPLGRAVRVRNANGHWSRTTRHPWYVVSEDENDTAQEAK